MGTPAIHPPTCEESIDNTMLGHIFIVFLASTSAYVCKKKLQRHTFVSEHPTEGKCEYTGLGWTGRDPDNFKHPNGEDVGDQFFTKWTELFQQPECIGRIEVHVSDTAASNDEHNITTIQDFTRVNKSEQNPSNTVLITHQPDICTRRAFQSRLVFFPKNSEKRVLHCYELKRTILLAHHTTLPLTAFFLNNLGPTQETTEDNSGVNVFWRRGMVDTCIQAVEVTIKGKTTSIQKKR